MNTQWSDGAHSPVAGDVRPAEGQIVRRAVQLCVRAEPHTEATPCSGHLHEAQRQLDRPR
jgi:hypothetical protein